MKNGPHAPQFSAIITCFQEGDAARISIESVLSQSFTDLELIIVLDGSDDCTKEVVHSYRDTRIRVVQQSNDGLSSARNRAMSLAIGKYLAFLDADDMRPTWAFKEAWNELKVEEFDILISPGRLIELRNESLPFYDDAIFGKLGGLHFTKQTEITKALPSLLLLEPQTANKIVKTALIRKYGLCFPNGLFYEDFFFHVSTLMVANSLAVSSIPMFTYHRRYGAAQITSGTGINRIHSIETAKLVFQLWHSRGNCSNLASSAALLLSLFRLLHWCELSISIHYRDVFRDMLNQEFSIWRREINHIIQTVEFRKIMEEVTWGGQVTDYMRSSIFQSTT